MTDNSIDLVVTDPPYGVAFMGKHWDKAVPPVDVWRECLRVLKPGAFAFIMSLPRQDVLARMIINLEDAGFQTGFTSIYWTFATGFPKAQNIGKAADKKLGVAPLEVRPAAGVGFMNTKDDGYHATKNQVVMPKRTTSQAKDLDGSYAGFQPKPAVEVVLVVMKPLSEKTYVEQALNNGKGVTWLDGCRVPYKEKLKNTTRHNSKTNEIYGGGKGLPQCTLELNTQGRFPANILVSDDVLNDGRVSKSAASGYNYEESNNDNPTRIATNIKSGVHFSDSGSFSRYFSLDAWWDKQVKELPKSVQKTFPFLIVPKAGKREKNEGCKNLPEKIGGGMSGTQDKSLETGSGNERNNLHKNHHPTVKPLQLMSYLVTLGSREGDTVLDPYAGSGTTAVACKVFSRKFIGIELEKEYHEIATSRMSSREDWLF